MSGIEEIAAVVALAGSAVAAQQQSDAGFKAKLAAQKQASLATIAGDQQKGESDQEAAQLEASANADRAASQRAAVESKRQAAYGASRAMAVAAASGGSTLDPSVVNTIAGFDSAGDLAANTDLYNGETSARNKEYGAFLKTNQGRDYAAAGRTSADALMTAGQNAQKAANAQAGSTILSGVSSFASSYSAPKKKPDNGFGESFTSDYATR